MKIDFKVKRSEDCVLIDTKNWVQNTSNTLRGYRMSGRDFPTYLARALSTNTVSEKYKDLVKEGDLVLISRVASEVASFRTFAVEPNDSRYYNVPISQICGIFRNDFLTLDSLEVITDKVLVERIEVKCEGLIEIPNDNTMLGKVLKKGPLSKIEVGEVVLIRDNVTTDITLEGKGYYVVDNDMIVGVFPNEDSVFLNNLKVLNKSILMSQFIPEKALNSKLLTPTMNYEDSDYSEIYNRDLFRVEAVDTELTKVHVNDILLLNRDITNYVFLRGDKFFIVSGMDYVEAKIED